jgi:hypothetical protein
MPLASRYLRAHRYGELGIYVDAPWIRHQNLGSTMDSLNEAQSQLLYFSAPPTDTAVHIKVASDQRVLKMPQIKGGLLSTGRPLLLLLLECKVLIVATSMGYSSPCVSEWQGPGGVPFGWSQVALSTWASSAPPGPAVRQDLPRRQCPSHWPFRARLLVAGPDSS